MHASLIFLDTYASHEIVQKIQNNYYDTLLSL